MNDVYCIFDGHNTTNTPYIWHGSWLDIDCFENLCVRHVTGIIRHVGNGPNFVYRSKRMIYIVVQR